LEPRSENGGGTVGQEDCRVASKDQSGGDLSWLGLAGKVAVVTGAAGAIGSEIARHLAAAGAPVALLDRDGEGAERVAATVREADADAIGFACDITDRGSVAAAAERVAAELGPCRILVNNAAAIYADALMDIDIEKWNRLLAVNLNGALLCAQAFGRQMQDAGGGAMIHIGSISGHFAQPYAGAYSVSKAGLTMLSQLLAAELGSRQIRSNVVSPGMVHTPMTEVIYRDPAVKRRREEMTPAGRISRPQDVAEAVLFLASDRSSYITGQDILVDGGLSQAFLTLIPRPGFEKKDVE
jgi:NAD(P)-dependent dehydrogenase (short-subunit alcohol dehydrogenase family)